MDDCSNTADSVAAGVGKQLHDGRVYSRPPGDCHRRCGSRLHSRATIGVRKWLAWDIYKA